MIGGPSGTGLTRRFTPALRSTGADNTGAAVSSPRTVWWMPLAFVALVLVVLTATPVLVNYRVRHLRDQLSDGSGAGRVIVNDLEVAFATQLLIHEQSQFDGARKPITSVVPGDGTAANSLALTRERNDEVALDSVVRRVGPDAVERFVELRTLAQSWHDGLVAEAASPNAVLSRRASNAAAPDVSNGLNVTAQQVLDAAESLDNYLEALSLQQRGSIQRLERINFISAVILAPLALAAALALFWTGRRILFFANAAERNSAALSRAMTSKAALVRGLTHDLKNPLGAAYGYAELLEDEMVGPVLPEQREMLARIKGLVTLSVTTVNDLLELYRDGSDGLQLQRVPTDLENIVGLVVADFQAEATHAGLTLAFNAPAQIGHEDTDTIAERTIVGTDPSRVRQILGNLVSNAIKYTPAGGNVHLSIRRPTKNDARAAVDVRDTGPGIPAPYQERIFEEFFRLPEDEGITGTGVGLAISRRFARLLGGELTVTDWFEGGSVFTLWLPTEQAGSSLSPERVA
jgi:signal transduction histidine kinase